MQIQKQTNTTNNKLKNNKQQTQTNPPKQKTNLKKPQPTVKVLIMTFEGIQQQGRIKNLWL